MAAIPPFWQEGPERKRRAVDFRVLRPNLIGGTISGIVACQDPFNVRKWRPILFCLLRRAQAPCGPSVRAVKRTKSKKKICRTIAHSIFFLCRPRQLASAGVRFRGVDARRTCAAADHPGGLAA